MIINKSEGYGYMLNSKSLVQEHAALPACTVILLHQMFWQMTGTFSGTTNDSASQLLFCGWRFRLYLSIKCHLA